MNASGASSTWTFRNSFAPFTSPESDESDDSPIYVESEEYPEPDMAFINELIEHIERNLPALEARKLLMREYARCGWFEAGRDIAQEIFKIDPSKVDATIYTLESSAASWWRDHPNGKGKGKQKEQGLKKKGKGKGKEKQMNPQEKDVNQMPSIPTWRPSLWTVTSPIDTARELESGYIAFLAKAAKLQQDIKDMRELKSMRDLGCEKHGPDTAQLASGKISTVLAVKPLGLVRLVSRAMVAQGKDNPEKCLDIVVRDFGDVISWVRNTDDGREDIRETLVKRVRLFGFIISLSVMCREPRDMF